MSEHIFRTEQQEDGMAVYIEKDTGIVSAKPAQLGEIVRCRDCAILNEDTGECYAFTFGSLKFIPRPDHFCANGVRES